MDSITLTNGGTSRFVSFIAVQVKRVGRFNDIFAKVRPESFLSSAVSNRFFFGRPNKLAHKPDTTLRECRGGSYRTYTCLHSTLTHVHRSPQSTNHKALKIGIRKE